MMERTRFAICCFTLWTVLIGCAVAGDSVAPEVESRIPDTIYARNFEVMNEQDMPEAVFGMSAPLRNNSWGLSIMDTRSTEGILVEVGEDYDTRIGIRRFGMIRFVVAVSMNSVKLTPLDLNGLARLDFRMIERDGKPTIRVRASDLFIKSVDLAQDTNLKMKAK